MRQTRLQSLVEAWAGTVLGFFLSLGLQQIVAWWYHTHTTFIENVQIVGLFTLLSVVRSYCVRRYFNHIHHTHNKDNSIESI